MAWESRAHWPAPEGSQDALPERQSLVLALTRSWWLVLLCLEVQWSREGRMGPGGPPHQEGLPGSGAAEQPGSWVFPSRSAGL